MNKKVLAIVIAAIVLTLGIVLVISYKDTSKDQVNTKEEKEQVQDRQETEETEEKETSKETKKEEVEEVEEVDIAIGELAPDFTLKNLDGEEVSLSDYKGKIVLINFWATWCKFCDVEMPDLNNVDKKNDDVVVLAVNVQEEQPKVSEYIKEGGYDFEVVLDTKGNISRNYLVSSFPTTYAVDKEGILVGGVPGMLTKPQMEQIIENVRTGN